MNQSHEIPVRNGVGRFLLGLLGVLAFFGGLAYLTPPDPVVRHNLNAGIDATPLFYSESDRVQELERSLHKPAKYVELPQ